MGLSGRVAEAWEQKFGPKAVRPQADTSVAAVMAVVIAGVIGGHLNCPMQGLLPQS